MLKETNYNYCDLLFENINMYLFMEKFLILL